MEFTFDHAVQAPVEAVLSALCDEAFYTFTTESTSSIAPPELLDLSRDGDVVVTRVRYAFTGSLSGPAAGLIDANKLTWVIQSELHVPTARATLTVIPDHYEKMITCSGTVLLESSGATSTQQTSGDLRLHIPLVAKAGERAIIAGLDTHLDQEASRLGAYCSSI